jgi:hypothetical protein
MYLFILLYYTKDELCTSAMNFNLSLLQIKSLSIDDSV